MSNKSSSLQEIIQKHQNQILEDWLVQQKSAALRNTMGRETELRVQSGEFITLFAKAVGNDAKNAGAWTDVRNFIDELSRVRVKQGFSSSETALFIFSLKEPIIKTLRIELESDPVQLIDETFNVSTALDQLGLFSVESYQRTREDVIARQQQELLELSTPVVTLWDQILALPLIGTLDSARTQVVMESLLQEIVRSGALIAIIDITGVPTVDTLVAQHLLKTVAAARLMGADCIISGIRPQIAQTIVHLGVELNDVITKATLADAFSIALTRTGKMVVSKKRRSNDDSETLSLVK